MVAILIVSTSHAILGDSKQETGVFAEEIASPYYVFKNAGYDVKIASIAGGKIPLDGASLKPPYITPTVEKMLQDSSVMKELEDTPAVTSQLSAYDAIYLPGGHGTCWDFPNNPALKELVEGYYKSGKIVSAVCHGVAALLDVTDANGVPILKGRKVTGFSNTEEHAVGKENFLPFLLEDAMKAKGADYSSGADWSVHVLRDGNVITGQNPSSSERVADMVVEALKENTAAKV